MTTKNATALSAKTTAEVRVNEKKWSKELMDAGWTAIPSVIIERQQALGLDALDINILVYLATFWWTPDNKPRPSKKTIAAAIGVTPRSVQRRIAAMEKEGLIAREEHRVRGKGSRPNVYHFDGLIKAAQPYALEKMQKLAKQELERKKTAARKGRAKLEIVKSSDGEE
jgi:predicted transcriptional regulator